MIYRNIRSIEDCVGEHQHEFGVGVFEGLVPWGCSITRMLNAAVMNDAFPISPLVVFLIMFICFQVCF